MFLNTHCGTIFTFSVLASCIQSYCLPRYSSEAVRLWRESSRCLSVGYSWTEYQSTAEVWRVCILVMFESICLLFADDAAFLTSLEFGPMQWEWVEVRQMGKIMWTHKNIFVNVRTLYPYSMSLLNNSFQNYRHWYAATVQPPLFWEHHPAAGGCFH